jgi:hypothetical protein
VKLLGQDQLTIPATSGKNRLYVLVHRLQRWNKVTITGRLGPPRAKSSNAKSAFRSIRSVSPLAPRAVASRSAPQCAARSRTPFGGPFVVDRGDRSGVFGRRTSCRQVRWRHRTVVLRNAGSLSRSGMPFDIVALLTASRDDRPLGGYLLCRPMPRR